MTIDRYLALFRSQRRLILAVTASAALFAALLWAVDRPDRRATTELFAGTADLPRSLEQAYEAERYTEERMRSYSRVLAGPLGARTIRDELDLEESVGEIEDEIEVAVPPHGVLAEVTVTDPSAERAQAMANALGENAGDLIDRLEGRSGATPLRVTVIRPAELGTPVAPLWIYVALGLLLGAATGFGAALLRESLGRRRFGEAEARAAARAPVLGRIPEHPDEPQPVMSADPRSPGAEAFRSLRSNLTAVAEEHDRRVLAVTSAMADEGKTEVAANLGLALAGTGASVALVDANLHSPRLAERLGLGSDFGLVDVLTGTLSLDLALSRLPSGGLRLLAGGAPGQDATELLDGDRFGAVLKELSNRFDWVIVDAPALLPATDALVVARQAGAAVLVSAGRGGREALRRATQELAVIEADLLGLVLNRVPPGLVADRGYGSYGRAPRAALAGSGRGDGRRPV